MKYLNKVTYEYIINHDSTYNELYKKNNNNKLTIQHACIFITHHKHIIKTIKCNDEITVSLINNSEKEVYTSYHVLEFLTDIEVLVKNKSTTVKLILINEDNETLNVDLIFKYVEIKT